MRLIGVETRDEGPPRAATTSGQLLTQTPQPRAGQTPHAQVSRATRSRGCPLSIPLLDMARSHPRGKVPTVSSRRRFVAMLATSLFVALAGVALAVIGTGSASAHPRPLSHPTATLSATHPTMKPCPMKPPVPTTTPTIPDRLPPVVPVPV